MTFQAPTRGGLPERLATALGESYQLGELLGAGGFAEVYGAFDRRLKRRVAVKVLRDELRNDRVMRERFRREAEAVAQLRHPHIVPIYAVGEDEDVSYFVMPLLEGETLASALERESRWSLPEICRILREAASALAEAHRARVIHRDVKPENIMLDGPDRRVMIMDFGIAKAIDDPTSPRTATGMVIGSPLFMSPEQAAGDAVDAFSDQYSLALVGYRMLSGRLPFESENFRAILFMQATQEPPPVEALRPDTPPSLSAVIKRGLAKERSQRFPTMRDFETALTKVASEVAGDFRRQRATQSLEERWAFALSEVYDRPWRHAAVLVASLLAFIITYPRGESRGAREVLGVRGKAIAAARLALDSLAAPKSAETVTFQSRDRLYRYLQETLAPELVESVAESVGVWSWTLAYLGTQADQHAAATVGAGGTLLTLHASVDDSVALPAISEDSAQDLAVAFLRRHAHHPAAFEPGRLSRRDLPARRDYELAWTMPSGLPKRGDDSTTVSLSVGIAGDRVMSFADTVEVHESSEAERAAADTSVIAGLGVGAALLLFLVALWIAAKRATFDTIQWGMTTRLTALYVVVYLVGHVFPGIPSLRAPLLTTDNAATVANHIAYGFGAPDLIGPALMLLVMLAATESLLYELRPELVAGLTEIGRFRLRSPDVLRALPAGIALGASLAAVRAIGGVVGRYWLNLPIASWTAVPALSVSSRWPALGTLTDAGVFVQAFTALAFLVAIAIRLHRAWLAPLGGAVLWMGLDIAIYAPNVLPWQAALDGLVVGLAGIILLRHGVLAAGLSLLLSMTIPIVYDLFWAGGPFLAAGIQVLVLLLLPVALGVIIYRRHPSGPAAVTASQTLRSKAT